MTFSPPAFITIGDEYDKKDQIPDRYKGKNFKTAGAKKGALGDALFQKKFLSLSEGDKYVDSGYFDKRARLENEKKKLNPQGFKYANPPKKACGSGTYFGTFSERNPPKHEVEYDVVQRGQSPDKAHQHLKNITTKPPPKGTYGFPGRSIGKGNEYKYISDPYDGERRKDALAAKQSAKKIVGAPFKGSCKHTEFFDETPHGISKVYTIDKALPAKKPAGDEHKSFVAKPFKPSSANFTVSKYPPYQEDPYEAKEKAAREQRKKDRVGTVWKPIGATKSLPTKPIKFTPPA
jgi:hypothetical protein